MNDKKHPCIVIIVDGLGDRPVAPLGGKTPLEAARTPHLDLLAAAGSYGLVDPVGPGVTPNTHSGAGILLGLPAENANDLRRGPVEAAGAGRELKTGEIALRVNFASVKPAFGGFIVTDRRAGRISAGTEELGALLRNVDLGDGVRAEFRSTDQHRGVVVLSGKDLDAAISDTDPGDEEMPAPLLRCQALRFSAKTTADKINKMIKVTHELLQDHPVNAARVAAGRPPANGLITRGAGTQVSIGNIISQAGLSAAVVSGCNTVRGLARIFGFEVISDARFTATSATDIEAKVGAALEASKRHDVAFIHFKAPDICAHDRMPLAKRNFLERMDKAFAPLMKEAITVALSADHTTDSNSGLHTADPVPSLLYSPRMGPGIAGIKFGETACQNGTMERQTSAEFLKRVLSFINAG